MLSLLDEHGLRMTWFIVGQDAVLGKNRAALSFISQAGHEVGNHSFHHQPWIRHESAADVAAELSLADDVITDATGQKPIGYRAPGYGVSRAELEAIASMGYIYDASTLPTFLGPLSRAYYFMITKLPKEECARRSALFGSMSDGFQSLKPYLWQLGDSRILELPVTTMPLTRTPIHFSYLLFLAARSPAAARQYFRLSLGLCRRFGVTPSLLLHPLDLLGSDDRAEFEFFPGMRMSSRDKLAFLDWALRQASGMYKIVPIVHLMESLQSSVESLPIRSASSLKA
ncbi:MAG: polysaccharide deacetylase family protein [Hyphomicrobiales bacterium]|nr:polysaccharide deacetylase family protein [Hyphomicrobiales bacterium]